MKSPLSPVAVADVESASSAVNWGPIVAGAFAASTLTVILMLVGSGLGLIMVSLWSGSSASPATFAVSTAFWLIIVQSISSGVGGYLAGRLRTERVGIHTADQVYFRDAAHGFLTWALTTLLVVGVLGWALSGALGSGVQAVSTVASGAALGASVRAASTENAIPYFVDTLFRPADPSKLAAADPQSDAAATALASRILINSAGTGKVSAEDKTYLSQLVAARTGLPEAEAKARVDAVIARIEDAKVKADTARKLTAILALVGALSLVIGAFIASAAAAFGGRQRDDEEAAFLTSD